MTFNSNQKLVLLSHVFAEDTPGYGGSVAFERAPASLISQGKSSNSEKWTLSNHCGTHIDFPRHFFEGAASFSSYQTQDFWMDQSFLIDLPLEKDHLITRQDLANISAAPDANFLLFRTGFEKIRHLEDYWKHNPGFHPDVADFLREKFPKLKAIGFDFISLTAQQHRELGREAHRKFLDPQKPIWIVEDMKLSALEQHQFTCLISPFPVVHADGTPVNVFAFQS